MNYRYTFDHKAKKAICPSCGERTLRTLKSIKTNEPCDPRYGVCERVNSCQYSRYPSKSEKEFVPLSYPKPMTRKTTWRCPENLVAMTTDSRGNVFGKWLVGLYQQRAVDELRMYRVGTYPKSDKHPEFSGSAIFWQIGSDNKHRSGKIIKYGPDGKRVKDFGSKWIHSVAYPGKSMDDLGIGQVPFGEHLIYDRPEDTVCVVESEKSAIICAIHYDEAQQNSITLQRDLDANRQMLAATEQNLKQALARIEELKNAEEFRLKTSSQGLILPKKK